MFFWIWNTLWHAESVSGGSEYLVDKDMQCEALVVAIGVGHRPGGGASLFAV